MKKGNKFYSLLVVMVLMGVSALAQNTWLGPSGTTSNPTTGSWATAANWSLGTVPVSGDAVVINPASAITISSVPAQTIASLTIGGNNKVTLSGGTNTLTINGVLAINGGSTLDVSTMILAGITSTSTNSTGKLRTASTSGALMPVNVIWNFDVELYASANSWLQGGTYSNVIISNTNTTQLGQDVTVNGNFTLGGKFDCRIRLLTVVGLSLIHISEPTRPY